jgi:hypothetical protein
VNKAEKELVEALRSGDYNQGKHALRKNGDFCCLGVACDIYNPSLWSNLGFQREVAYDGVFTKALPLYVRDHYGWLSCQGTLSFEDRFRNQLSLMGLNDAEFSFDQIADVIAAGLVLHKKGETL